MPTFAILDAAGVLQGFEKVPKKKWKPAAGRVPVPDDCDLAPGRYRWDGEQGTFVPLAPKGSGDATTVDVPSIHAIALGFASLHNQGLVLHVEALAWLRAYERSLDNKQPPEKRVTLER